jgi:large subunit ribosomal protein L10
MPSAIKERIVAELAARFRAMSHAVLVDYTGVHAGQADALRDRLEEQGASMFIVKNSLAVLALRQLELPDVAELLVGPTAFISGGADPALLAKAVLDWSRVAGGRRGPQLLTMRGGMLDGRALDASEMQRLASLPPLDVLRAQAVGAIAWPLTGFIGALQGIVRSFVGVIKAIAEKDES